MKALLQLKTGILQANASSKTWFRSKAKYRKPLDPQHAEQLPEFQYVGDSHTPGTRVYTWGVTSHGAVGRASFMQPTEKHQRIYPYIHRPHRLEFGEYHTVVDVDCGYGFTVFAVHVKNSPSCYGTGLTTDGQIGIHACKDGQPFKMLLEPAAVDVPIPVTSRVVKVSCGRAHTVMLTNCGQVWTVGNNAYGQCGRPIIEDEDYGRHATYHKIEELEGKSVKQVECGQDSSFFLTDDGQVFSCGWGADGQTGRGHYNNQAEVAPVLGDLQGEKVLKVSSHADCVLALSNKGEVFGWGNSEYHQLGSATSEQQLHTPTRLKLPGIKSIKDVAAAGTACFVLDESGRVFSWGYGMLGRGPKETYSETPRPIPLTLFGRNQLSPEVTVKSITCGVNMVAAVNSEGNLYTWGVNHGGCLGLGHKKEQFFPLRVSVAGTVLKASCGVDHMCIIVRGLL